MNTMRAIRYWILGLAFALPAQADDGMAEAEHVRLAVEMDSLAHRQAWKGVEKKYEAMLRLGIGLNYSDHLHGAYASRELGDVQSCYVRLKAAVAEESTKEVVDWLWNIDNNYGHVEVSTVPSRSAELIMKDPPFDPNERRALEAAVAIAKEDGTYSGLLPRGAYTFAGQGFTVEPGISVRIEVSPRVRRQGPVDPVIRYQEAPVIYMGESSDSENDE